jgi:hypothetical protein
MISPILRPPISHRRKALALTIAGIADMIQLLVIPAFIEGAASPLNDIVDVLTALLLTAVCGFKWQFVFAFFMELIPGLDLLPTWSAVALLIPSRPNDLIVTRTASPTPPHPSLHPPIITTAVSIPPVQSHKTP